MTYKFDKFAYGLFIVGSLIALAFAMISQDQEAMNRLLAFEVGAFMFRFIVVEPVED